MKLIFRDWKDSPVHDLAKSTIEEWLIKHEIDENAEVKSISAWTDISNPSKKGPKYVAFKATYITDDKVVINHRFFKNEKDASSFSFYEEPKHNRVANIIGNAIILSAVAAAVILKMDTKAFIDKGK